MVMRKVWLLKAPVSAGAGAVVQVPTQCWLSGMSLPPSPIAVGNLMSAGVPWPTQSAVARGPIPGRALSVQSGYAVHPEPNHAVQQEEEHGSLFVLALLAPIAGAAAGLLGAVFRLALEEADRLRDA